MQDSGYSQNEIGTDKAKFMRKWGIVRYYISLLLVILGSVGCIESLTNYHGSIRRVVLKIVLISILAVTFRLTYHIKVKVEELDRRFAVEYVSGLILFSKLVFIVTVLEIVIIRLTLFK
jgi:hypothetical protein